jgi:hypothetical protein
MKYIARAIVVVLVLTGAAASTQLSSASPSKDKIMISRPSMLPVPTCDPNDPNACGFKG